MKLFRLFLLSILLFGLAIPAMAEENDDASTAPVDFRNHVTLPQLVLSGGVDGQIGVYATGYHFTLVTVWDRVSLGGFGAGFGWMTSSVKDETRTWTPQFYAELPVVDVSMLPDGYGDDDDVSFEFTSAILYGLGERNPDVGQSRWGFRALFGISWQ